VDIDRELLESNKFRIRPLTSDYLRPRNHPLKVSLYQGSVAEPDERFVDFDLISCIELYVITFIKFSSFHFAH